MSDKISSVAVVKEALALSWARKWTFMGLIILAFVGAFALSFGAALMGAITSESSIATVFFGAVIVIAELFAAAFMLTAMNHLAVTLQRGEGRAFFKGLLPRMGGVFVRLLLIWLTTALATLIVMAPFALAAWLLVDDWENVSSLFAVVPPFFLLLMIPVYALMCRLWLMIPGASVGEKFFISRAFALSKGHTWKMFLSYLMIILPAMAICLFIVFGLFGAGTVGGIGVMAFLMFILIFVFELAVVVIIVTCNCVWYEKLRLRYEEIDEVKRVADMP